MLKITRRGVQIALGILWLLDGGLQLQHQMFTSNFANNVIAPAAQGQPVVVSGPIHFGIHIILLQPAFFDACFALIQLGLGIAILWKPTSRYGLWASVVWALAVWFGGEGLAGMASGHASLLMGAPGAASIYAVLALAVLPPKTTKTKPENQHPAFWLVLVWAVLWVGGCIFQLLPGQNSVSDVSGMISSMANGAPGWLASLDNHVAKTINGFGTPMTSMANMHMTAAQMAQMSTRNGSGYWFIALMATIQIGIGIAVFFSGYTRKAAIGLGVIASLIFWILGQALGGYFTGLATDPNSGPLFVLLGIAIIGVSDLDKKLALLYKRIETTMIGQ